MAERRRERVVPSGIARLSPARRATTGFGLVLAAVGVLGLTQACGSSEDGPRRAAEAAVAPSATVTSAGTTPTATPTTSGTATPTPTRTTPAPARTATPRPPPTLPRPTTKPQPKQAATMAPMSLSARSIGVKGSIRRIQARNGVVNPPSGRITWVSGYGRVRPGEVGTAVIAGHVVDGRRPDVFYRLQEIDRGDKVTVWDSDGKPVVYTVTATRVATKTSVSRDPVVWGGNRSVRRIALITCDDDQGYRADGHRVANFVAIAEAR